MTGAAEQHWLDTFEARGRSGEPGWRANARREAMARFAKRGFPKRRDEDWKYVNPERIAAVPYRSLPAARPASPEVDKLALAPKAGPLLVFVNGRHAPQLSRLAGLPEGVDVCAWSDFGLSEEVPAPRYLRDEIEDRPFAQLVEAFFEDGLHVRVPPDCLPGAPVTVLFLTVPEKAPAASHPRLRVELGARSRLELYEVHAALGSMPYLKNYLAEFEVAEGAACTRVKLQDEAEAATHLATVSARVGAKAQFESHIISWGGHIAREELLCRLDEEGAFARLNGLYATRDGQQSDIHTVIDHAVPGCKSRELFRGVLAGASRGAFSGRVVVRPDAQQSDAEQKSESLLLSENAEADSKPQLEIYADDVRCSHGATIGQLDPEQIFYLRSRGIDEARARAVLTRGFASTITAAIGCGALRDRVEAILVERLFADPAVSSPPSPVAVGVDS